MKVEWLPAAVADRRAATKYLQERNPKAARRLLQALIEASNHLTTFPLSGRIGKIVGTREIVPVPTYVIVYKVDEQAAKITILRIWHTAQNR